MLGRGLGPPRWRLDPWPPDQAASAPPASLLAAREVYGRLKDGCYGLTATLLTVVFLALAGEPRAEGATRVPPGALGRVLGPGPGAGGQDDPPQARRARRRRARQRS